MENSLGLDGLLERYSRGLDTWVPLDSEASFAAMRRSIDVQRKSGDKHSARVLLRIKAPKQALERVNEKLQSPQEVTQPPAPAPTAIAPGAVTRIKAPPMPITNGPMTFRPFAPPLAPPAAVPLERTSNVEPVNHIAHFPIAATGIPAPPPPPPPQPPIPPQPALPAPQHVIADPMPPQLYSGWTFPPPPPPPPVGPASVPPFPFGPSSSNGEVPYGMPPSILSLNVDQRRLPPISTQFLPSYPNDAPGAAPPPPHPPMPLPPLVPDRLHPIMPRPPVMGDRLSVLTDASDVLNLLGELESKVVQMGDKVEQIQLDEKKHYESLRRGLKRLKDEKPAAIESPDVAFVQRATDGLSITAGENTLPNKNGDAPYCICNYCIQRTSPV